jgi:hypothetical protein
VQQNVNQQVLGHQSQPNIPQNNQPPQMPQSSMQLNPQQNSTQPNLQSNLNPQIQQQQFHTIQPLQFSLTHTPTQLQQQQQQPLPLQQQLIDQAKFNQTNLNPKLNEIEKLNPDSVYKPGYLNSIKMNINASPPAASLPSLPQQTTQANGLDKNNSRPNTSLTPINYSQNNQMASTFIPQQQQQQLKPISQQQPQIQPSMNQQQQQQQQPLAPQRPKPSAIDDLLDIFDSNSPSLNQQIQTMAPLVLQPFKIEVIQNKVEKVNTTTQNSLSMEKVTIDEEKPKDVNNIKNNNSNLADPSTLSQITTKSLSSAAIITNGTNGTNGNGVQSTKRLNFLNSSSKLERFVSEVNKFENHVNSLPKKNLATSVTMLEKEWKELQVDFLFY